MSRCTLADLALEELHETRPIEGQPIGGVHDKGLASLFEVTGPDNLHLTLADRHWRSGARDISTLESHGSPERFDRLKHGLRLGVTTRGAGCWVELRQARIRHGSANEHSNLFKASLADLAEGAGLPVERALNDLGATVGTREALLGEKSNRRTYLCAVFDTDASRGPVSAYVLTRVLPLLNRLMA